MATIKNNPYDLLKAEGISVEQLSEEARESLALFDKVMRLHEKRPESKEFFENAQNAATKTSAFMAKAIAKSKAKSANTIEEVEKRETKKMQSKKTVEKAGKVLDDLGLCREKLKADRKRKLESGEISPPKKKTLTTKLRTDLLHFGLLIPAKLRSNPKVIERTQQAILRFLAELKSIWGLDKIKTITDEIREQFKKLEEAAIKPKDYRQN